MEKNAALLIPQQPPFVMVGELLFADELTARTRFRITEENVLTDNGVFSEAGLLENLAQTAAAHAGHHARAEQRPVRTGYIGAVKNFEVYSRPSAGSVLETEIKIEDRVFNATLISGRTWCNKVLVAQCEMKLFIAES